MSLANPTLEDVWRLFQESDRKFQETERLMKESSRETDRKFQETDRLVKQLSKNLGELGNRLGEFVEHLVAPAVVRLFRAQGIEVHAVYPGVSAHRDGEGLEIDLLVVNDGALAACRTLPLLPACRLGRLSPPPSGPTTMPRFRPIDRDLPLERPLSLQDWLPEGHLARYVVEVVEALDLSALIQAYAGRGSLPYHPAMMLSLLIYGYATGCDSSRRIALATFDSVAFRFIAGNQHPDHDSLATFRRRFRVEFEAVFIQVLEVARENQLSRFGRVSLDGTKIHANASRHSALSYKHAQTIEAQLKADVQDLLALAEQTDGRNVPEGMIVPEELQRREARLAAIAEAKRQIEARAAERYAREQAADEAKLAARAAKAAASGRKPGGKAPKAPSPAPRADDQINLTDDESRIMHVAGGGFEQCDNAQAVVDTESMLITVAQVTQAANDKEPVAPMVERLQALPEGLSQPEEFVADNGYFSERNVAVCENAGIVPLIAMKREEHHPHWSERFSEPDEAPPPEATPVARLAHRLKTRAGRAADALRKQTVEPVFGIIKSVMGFRQFLTRGLQNAQGEWTLVCLAWNLKRMAVLRP